MDKNEVRRSIIKWMIAIFICICILYLGWNGIMSIWMTYNIQYGNSRVVSANEVVELLSDEDSKKLVDILVPIHVLPHINTSKDHPVVFIRCHNILIGVFKDSDFISINEVYYKIGRNRADKIWNEILINYGGDQNE